MIDKQELIRYIRDALASGSSPAEEVLVVDDTICARIGGELIGIELVPVKISLGKDKKTNVKKPAKKKSASMTIAQNLSFKGKPKKPAEKKPIPKQ